VPDRRLSDAAEYRLESNDQDWRGWPVQDAAGTPMGRVDDFLLDDANQVVSIVLSTAREVPIDAVIVEDDHLVIPVAAPATAHPGAFENGNFDVWVRVEEAIIRKRPKVVEEIVVSHEWVERRERIRARVRRRDVEVESLTERS
jgi:hypothetical protein